jgi:hypothetical protein
MTWGERIRTVAEVATAVWQWVLLLGMVVVILLLVRACDRVDAAEAKLRRATQAAEFVRLGMVVAVEATQAQLVAAAKTIGTKIPALEAEMERVRKAAPDVRIVRVEGIVTAAAPAEGTPLPDPKPGDPCPECLFARGDTGQIEIDGFDAETKEGVRTAHVAASCWRVTPGPRTRILSGLADAENTVVLAEQPPLERRLGWGGGVAGGIGTTGPLGSALVETPPVFGERLSAVAIVSAGPGLFAGQVGILWRP